MAKQKVSDRTLLTSEGNEAERMNDATGAAYKLVANGKEFIYQYGQNEHADRMFGIFGFITKVGNEANTVLNNEKEPGDADDAATAIEEFLANVANGTWREVGEGVSRGPKYDKDVLAQAIVDEIVALGKAPAGDVASYRVRLDDKSYYAKVRANMPVMARYAAAMAERGKAAGATAESLI
jgi:hypothetical protein